MYYRLNGMTGRLAGAPPTAYCPQGLKPAVPADPLLMTFASPTKLVSEAGSTVEYLGANKVPDMQRLFQKPDGIPIHLKRGLMDKMLYRTTLGLTAGGALYCLVALYMAAQPNKP